MSISSLTNTAFERDTRSPQRRSRTALAGSPSSGPPTRVDQSKTEILLSFIPTEILTGYLAVVGTVAATVTATQPRHGLRWVMFALFALLTPLTVYAVWRAKLRGHPVQRAAPWLEMAAATVAFVIWAVALPDSPLTTWSHYDRSYPVIAVVIGGLLLTLVAPFMQRTIVTEGQGAGLRALRRPRRTRSRPGNGAVQDR